MQFEKRKTEWLEYDLLEPYTHLFHGTFLRHGGVSEGHFTSLNVGNATSDHPDNVKRNREIVNQAAGVDVIYPHQSHGAAVQRITAKNRHQLPHADALFTTEKKIGLGIAHADCQAAIMYDPEHEAIGAVHAGWRGSVQNIYAATIGAMREALKTDPKKLIVCVSPSLCAHHSEFKKFKTELPEEFWTFQTKPTYFDFWAITKKQLAACGVLDQNIEFANVCTYCEADDYYSHRREKETGRHATVVALI